MGLLGSSEVRESVDASVDEMKERSDEVDVSQMRSPQELIEQVDRLEEVVAGLRQRQEEIAKGHSEDIHELEFGEAIDFSGLKRDIENAKGDSVDLGNVEKRLDMLEMAVDRLEAGFEMDAEDLRENIIEEAIDIENRRLKDIQDRLDELETEIHDSELEEKVDFSQLKQEIEQFRQETGEIDSLIGHTEVNDKLSDLEGRRKEAEEDLKQRIVSLESRLDEHNIEEKVDSSRLHEEIEQLRDDLEWEMGEKEHQLQQEIEEKTNHDLEERIAVLEEGVEALVQDSPEMEERMEKVENKIEELAERDQEVTQDIDERLKALENSSSAETGNGEGNNISEKEFQELKQEVEEMSELLVKVAKQNS